MPQVWEIVPQAEQPFTAGPRIEAPDHLLAVVKAVQRGIFYGDQPSLSSIGSPICKDSSEVILDFCIFETRCLLFFFL